MYLTFFLHSRIGFFSFSSVFWLFFGCLMWVNALSFASVRLPLLRQQLLLLLCAPPPPLAATCAHRLSYSFASVALLCGCQTVSEATIATNCQRTYLRLFILPAIFIASECPRVCEECPLLPATLSPPHTILRRHWALYWIAGSRKQKQSRVQRCLTGRQTG